MDFTEARNVMQRVHATIGLVALMGAALVSSPALAVTAFSPTGNLNVRSGPGFQYQVMNQISANVPVEITGCVSIIPGAASRFQAVQRVGHRHLVSSPRLLVSPRI